MSIGDDVDPLSMSKNNIGVSRRAGKQDEDPDHPWSLETDPESFNSTRDDVGRM